VESIPAIPDASPPGGGRHLLPGPTATVRLVSLVALASGVLSLLSIAAPTFPARRRWVEPLMPIDLTHASRFAALLCGFALIIASLNLWKRKRVAWRIATALAALGVPFHLLKGHDHAVSIASLLLFGALIESRRHFTVRSGPPDFLTAMLHIGCAIGAALLYGMAGFWFLDPRAFGVSFNLAGAFHQTLLCLTLRTDPRLAPQTHHAAWFLDSIELMSFTTVLYVLVSLTRPAVHVYRTAPRERARAGRLVGRHGRSALDYFKVWPDKSFFFTADDTALVSYGASAGCAVSLGDPVGPAASVPGAIREFTEFCLEQDWRPGFHQVQPDFLADYRALGYRRLKVGEDAIVALDRFSLSGKPGRDLRHTLNQLEKAGVTCMRYEPPHRGDILRELREVSDDWLRFPGRRERRFTLGFFAPEYLRRTPVLIARDAGGRALAFVNVIPSFAPGEATIDLMRRRDGAPNGIMDYLFVRIFEDCQERGFSRLNLGLAPMSGFGEREDAGPEERAVHLFMQRLNFLFSYRGLRAYKAKFATSWEPRYTMYRNALDLPIMAIAIARLSEIRD